MTMTEQEFLDILIQERISMLFNNRASTKPKKSSETHEKMIKAEHLIHSLPKQQQDLVQSYVDGLIEMFTNDEPFLYQQGFFDGIRAMKFITNLY